MIKCDSVEALPLQNVVDGALGTIVRCILHVQLGKLRLLRKILVSKTKVDINFQCPVLFLI